VIAAVLFVYSFVVDYGELIGLPDWTRPERWPKIPLAWATAIIFAALFFIVLEGGIRLRGEAETKFNADIDQLKTQLDEVKSAAPEVLISFNYQRGMPDDMPITIENYGPGVARNVRIELEDSEYGLSFRSLPYLPEQKPEPMPVAIIGLNSRLIESRELISFFRGRMQASDDHVDREISVSFDNKHGVRFEQKFLAVYDGPFDSVHIQPSGGRRKIM